MAPLLAGCRGSSPKPKAAVAERAEMAQAPTLPPKRLVFPWSVVAGGVDSPGALREAMGVDPVVAAHYAGLNPGAFRTERLPAKRQGYVSYRIRDKIYWTRRMVTLEAGETVLTDGSTVVRGRCGNLFSPAPRSPAAPPEIEPPEIAMDVPVLAAQLSMNAPSFPTPPPAGDANFHKPKVPGNSREAASMLPPPQAENPMPPAWVTGGIAAPAGGFIGVGGGEAEKPPAGAPAWALSPPSEIAPPLVLVPLAPPPATPLLPLDPPFPPPPVSTPPPPSAFPPTSPPPSRSPLPPGNFPPPGPPPSAPPASDPSPYPPPGVDPPPPGAPPFNPPLPGLPPDVAVPEPGAWVLFLLGIAAIAAGKIRRKS